MNSPLDSILHSDAPLVVIEAAAGCGKTWTAAKFAKEMSRRLSHQRVLLLSHTHAACGEFHRRCEGPGIQVDVETCDSFALKVVAPYAGALGLPVPLDSKIGRVGGIPFALLSEKAVELLHRAPSVARLIATRYPVIILDEHQDASLAQHELVMLLMRAGGSRLRIFGDPMQALHRGEADEFVDWDALLRSSSRRAELTEPKRWPEAPALGQWVTAARATLRAGGVLNLREAPTAVRTILVDQFAGRQRFKDPQRAAKLLNEFLDQGPGRSLIVAHLGDMVRTLAQSARWRAGVNEGAVLEHLDALLCAIESDGVMASAVAAAFVEFADAIGTGFGRTLRQGICQRAGPVLREQGAGSNQLAWFNILKPIYADPTHRGLAASTLVVDSSSPTSHLELPERHC